MIMEDRAAIEVVLDKNSGLVQSMMGLLRVKKFQTQADAMHALACMVFLSPKHRKAAVGWGLVPNLVPVLESHSSWARADAAWALGNMCLVSHHHGIQLALDAKAMPLLVKLLHDEHDTVVNQAAWSLAQCTRGTWPQAQHLIACGAVGALAKVVRGDMTPDKKHAVISSQGTVRCHAVGGGCTCKHTAWVSGGVVCGQCWGH